MDGDGSTKDSDQTTTGWIQVNRTGGWDELEGIGLMRLGHGDPLSLTRQGNDRLPVRGRSGEDGDAAYAWRRARMETISQEGKKLLDHQAPIVDRQERSSGSLPREAATAFRQGEARENGFAG